MSELSDAEVAILAAAAGAEVTRGLFGAELERYAKSPTDFATQADLESEQAIRSVLRLHRPDDSVVGEEYGAVGSSERRWFIDPLCGTLNFAAQNPLFSVNVALPHAGVAAVAQPMSGEIFWTAGNGVHIRTGATDAPATPSPISRTLNVVLETAPGTRSVGAELLTDPAFHEAFALRAFSTTLALTWVAAGRQAAYVKDGSVLDSVHHAAGTILCRAAGASVSSLDGSDLHTAPGLLATADAEIHQQALKLIAPHLPAVS